MNKTPFFLPLFFLKSDVFLQENDNVLFDHFNCRDTRIK